MNEIEQDKHGIYRASTSETCSKKCAINRTRRIQALNEHLDDKAEFLYENWERGYAFLSKDKDRCLCGHEIKNNYACLHIPSNTVIVLGSSCVDKIYDEYEGTKHEAAAARFVERMTMTCPECKNRKVKSYEFCGKNICVNCEHGLRKYYKGLSKKTGKPFSAWFCTEKKCKTVFVEPDEKKAIIRKTKS